MHRLLLGLLALAACPAPDAADAGTSTTTSDTSTTTDPSTAGTTSTTEPTTGESSSSTGDPCAIRERTAIDRPDDVDGPQVHVVFARTIDQPDRGLDVDGALATSVAVWNGWLADQTGGPALRLDTCGGELDVTYLELKHSQSHVAAQDPYIRNLLEDELAAAGALADDKLYAVYYDGASTYSCGGGAWPPLIVGRVAALYLRGEVPGSPPCLQPFADAGEPPGYLEFAMLHEILHTLGLAATCAPHTDNYGHTNDTPQDLLYSGKEPWYPDSLDPDHDDYYGHGDPDCPDLARSALLEPTPASPELPVGW